jgi:murein DD-endopeptidase MepM/ murein hydrolase activator NlpD
MGKSLRFPLLGQLARRAFIVQDSPSEARSTDFCGKLAEETPGNLQLSLAPSWITLRHRSRLALVHEHTCDNPFGAVSRGLSAILKSMQVFRFRAQFRLLSLLVCAMAFASSLMTAQTPAVTLTPTEVVAGSPELIRVTAPADATVEGDWLGRKIVFFHGRDGQAWYALTGVDVEGASGPSILRISVMLPKGGGKAEPARIDLSQSVEIHEAHYRTGMLTVAPQFVSPGPEALQRIHAEIALKKQVFAASAAEPLWSGDFRAPVDAPPTDSFGTRRTFNGQLASVHKGMDFRAPVGTVVRAGNGGVVVLARPLYYEGNCVVIDHGLGLFEISMHLSRIDVREGQRVSAGEPIGLSGATGRVTGPHLHWAVRWQGAYLDPAKLLQLDLSDVR